MALTLDTEIKDEELMNGNFALIGKATIPAAHHWFMIVASLLTAYLAYKLQPIGASPGIKFLAVLSGIAFVTLRTTLVGILLKHSRKIDGGMFGDNTAYGKELRYLNRGLRKMTPRRKQYYTGISWRIYSERIRFWAFIYYTLLIVFAGTCFGLTAYILLPR